MHGMKPDFEAYAAPTEHPLFLALCALVGLVGTDGERLIVLVCVLSPRRARLGHASGWATRASGCGRRWRGAVFVGLELRLPALRRARLRRRALPGARAVGRRARGAGAAPRRCRSWRRWPWPGCCAPRRGCWPAPTGCGAAGGGSTCSRSPPPRRWRGAWSTSGSPAIRSSRCTPPATSPTSSTATAGCPRSRARSSSFVTDTARPPVALAGRGGGAAAVAAAHRAARCTCPIALFGAGVVTFLATGLAGLSVAAALPHDPGGGRLPGRRLRRARLHDAARRAACATLWSRAAIGAAALGLVFVADQGARRRHAARRAALHQGLARRPRGHPARAGGAARPALRPADLPQLPARARLALAAGPAGAARGGAQRAPAHARRGDVRPRAPRSSSATASPPAPARRPTCPTRASSRSPATRASAPTRPVR